MIIDGFTDGEITTGDGIINAKSRLRYVVTGLLPANQAKSCQNEAFMRRKGKYGDLVGPYVKFNPRVHCRARD